MTVAVVGAGISGVACARALRAGGVDVRVLDRGHVPGGRMASRTIAGRVVDLGASYLTAADPRFVAVVEDWTARGLARRWTDRFATATPDGLGEVKAGPVRHGAPRGLRSLVEDLATGLHVERHEVAEAGPGRVDGQAYDAVVLAMPDPQAARLLADPPSEVADRTWEPVLAVAAGFPSRTWDLDGAFVNGSDVLGWMADDGRRRGDGAAVLVAHTTSPYAAEHLADPDAAVPGVLAELRRILGTGEPEWTRAQRWTFARPAEGREEPYLLLDGLGFCGDGWGRPKVETAWLSGHLLGEELARRLTGTPAPAAPAAGGC